MHQEENKTKITYYYLLAFSISIGGFLRFYNIGQEPLWLDEAWSYWFSSRTMLELWTIVPWFETNPPFYYTILKLWETFFGSSEAGLRSLSAVISIGCIPLVFMLGRLVWKSAEGYWLGAIAALFFAISPVHIQYAQEARPYAMLTFTATLTLCTFLWIMRYPTKACEPIIRKPFGTGYCSKNGTGLSRFMPWVIAIIAITFTLWLHNTSILYILSLSLLMLAWFFWELRSNKAFLNNILVVGIIIFLLWGPYLIVLIPHTMGARFPIDEITPRYISDTVSWLLYGNTISWNISANAILEIGGFAFIVVLATAGFQKIRRYSGNFTCLLIVGAILGPILAAILVSLLFMPILLAKTLVYVSVPFYIAVAAGIMMLRDSRKRVVAMVIVSLIFLKWSYNYHANDEKARKEPWDRIAQTVVHQANGDAVLLIPNYIEIPFLYYTEKLHKNNFRLMPLPFPISDILRPELSHGLVGAGPTNLQIKPSDIHSIKNVSAKKSPLWLITRREEVYDQNRLVFNFLMCNGDLISTQDFGEISICKFNDG